MRLIKRQTTNQRSITGKGVQYDIDDQVIVDSTRAMKVPTGTIDQRPGELGVATSSAIGQVRYNSTDQQLEAYQNGAWREVRFKEPNQDPGIVWQNLGVGNVAADETVFGELQSNDTDYPVPASANNIIVMIENVVQIPTTNYTIHQTSAITSGGAEEGPNHPYTASGSGWWIKFTSPVPTGKPVTVIHNLDK
jgi:hypothetical protein|tara:strand:- start:28 stop:606 length:579 start_codon:yes stop_codon:yes gene_type:complete